MSKSLELMIEPELMDAFDDLSRQQGTAVSTLIKVALEEFISSMQDELQMCHWKQARVHPPVLAVH